MMVVLTALLMIGVVGVVAAPGASAACTLAGTGLSSGDPHLIGTASDMRQLGMETSDGCGLDRFYKLTADIDMSTYGEWDGAGAYNPALSATRFTGTFDGNNKTIRHITAKATPGPRCVPISTVAWAAKQPPADNTPMPPTIQGVQRRPSSAPKPMRGRTI